MAENKKLEEIVDLLAEYGGFDRDYLRDKLLINFKEKADNKNKMEQVAAMFGKKLGEEFEIRYKDENYIAYFRNEGLRVRGLFCLTWDNTLVALLTGRAVIVDD